jgi:hypothetical protein
MSDEKLSLFEYLGVADQERIHTQILAWMLHPKNSPLNELDFKLLYETLFKTNLECRTSIEQVITEYKHVDLLILLNGKVISLENKFKSKQSYNQLKNYKEIIDSEFPSKTKEYYFLTISHEKANVEGWNDLDYKIILDFLNSIEETKFNKYLDDYRTLLQKLLQAREYFLSKCNCRNLIFERSGLKNSERIKNTNNNQKYEKELSFILNNKLELLYTQIFFAKIIENLRNKALESKNISYELSESNGKALIHFHFNDLIFNLPTITRKKLNIENDILIGFGFQIQGHTIKYVVAATSDSNDIGEKNKAYKESKCSDMTKEFEALLDEKFSGSTLTRNEGKTKFYRSYSKVYKAEITRLQNCSMDKYEAWIEEQVRKAHEFLDNTKKSLVNIEL